MSLRSNRARYPALSLGASLFALIACSGANQSEYARAGIGLAASVAAGRGDDACGAIEIEMVGMETDGLGPRHPDMISQEQLLTNCRAEARGRTP